MCRFSLSVSLCAPVAPAELDGKKVEQNQREYLHRLSAQKKMFVLLRWRGTRVCVCVCGCGCVWLWLCVITAVRWRLVLTPWLLAHAPWHSAFNVTGDQPRQPRPGLKVCAP